MRVLAHALIARKLFANDNPKIILGTMLPDLETYTQLGTFEMMEIHEGGRKLKEYLQRKAPEDLGYALGMLSHGVESFGVDYYNDRNWQKTGIGWAHLKKEPLIEEVTQLYQVLPETGAMLAHNFIELGVDFCLSQKQPETAEIVEKAIRERGEETLVHHLAACFHKEKERARQSLKAFFAHYEGVNLGTLEGQAKIWSRISEVLVKHSVSPKKIAVLIEKTALLVQDEWQEILAEITRKVSENEWLKEGKIRQEKEV